jgi:hypothetical protein
MINWLLLFIPLAIGLEHLVPERHLPVFVTSSLAILPLAAGWVRATEHLAERMGARPASSRRQGIQAALCSAVLHLGRGHRWQFLPLH